jgi:hypothetical protein
LTGTDAYYKIYGANAFEAIVMEDTVGNTGEVEVNITWIDKNVPIATVSYDPGPVANGNVTVTLTANEAIFKPDGWKGSTTGTIFTKTYTSSINENIIIYDLAGNTGDVTIVISRPASSGG